MLGSWLRFLGAGKKVRGNRSASRARRPEGRLARAMPSIESLEDRVVPALFLTADLQVLSVTHSPATAIAGSPETFVTRVRNNGPLPVFTLNLREQLSPSLTGVRFTPSAGTYVAATGIWTGLALAPGAMVTLTATGTLSSTATGPVGATATLLPVAGVLDRNPANNSLSNTVASQAQANLSVTQTNNSSPAGNAVSGGQVVYTVVVSNAGPSSVTGATFTDNLPAGIASDTWSAVASSGASVGSASGTGNIATTVNLAPGAKVTFTITATIATTATGTLANTATVAAPAGVTDPSTANNSATNTLTIVPTADLSVTQSDNSSPAGSAVPGQQVVYTVVVSNAGPNSVTAAPVTDNLPAGIASATWTAVASSGASVASASGTGNIATTVDLASGSSVTFTITATVAATATGTLANTVSVSAPTGTTDPNTANNTATDTLTLTPQADLSVTQSDDANGALIPGAQVVYTVVVTNAGPSSVTAAGFTDNLPFGITSDTWTAAVTSGVGSVASPGGTGNIATTVTLAPGATVTFTITGIIDPNVTGTLANTATVIAPTGVTDPNTANNSATNSLPLTPTADLAVTQSDNSNPAGTVIAGGTVVYTVTVSNPGPSGVTAASVTDNLPAGIASASWTAAASAGASVAVGSGTGNIATTVTLARGSSVTFTITATTDPLATGTLSNTFSVAAPTGVTDPNLANNSATDTLTLTEVILNPG